MTFYFAGIILIVLKFGMAEVGLGFRIFGSDSDRNRSGPGFSDK